MYTFRTENRFKKKGKSKRQLRKKIPLSAQNAQTNAPVICKTDQIRALKRLIGAMLIILAAVFAKALTVVPISVAFCVVFVYLSLQLWLWVELK